MSDVQTAAQATEPQSHTQQHGYAVYFRTWLLLAVVTACEVALFLTPWSRAVVIPLLLFATVIKAGYIFAYFMHLRFERLLLAGVAVVPIVIGIVMFIGMSTDFGL